MRSAWCVVRGACIRVVGLSICHMSPLSVARNGGEARESLSFCRLNLPTVGRLAQCNLPNRQPFARSFYSWAARKNPTLLPTASTSTIVSSPFSSCHSLYPVFFKPSSLLGYCFCTVAHPPSCHDLLSFQSRDRSEFASRDDFCDLLMSASIWLATSI
jgi:hypothetical protein